MFGKAMHAHMNGVHLRTPVLWYSPKLGNSMKNTKELSMLIMKVAIYALGP